MFNYFQDEFERKETPQSSSSSGSSKSSGAHRSTSYDERNFFRLTPARHQKNLEIGKYFYQNFKNADEITRKQILEAIYSKIKPLVTKESYFDALNPERNNITCAFTETETDISLEYSNSFEDADKNLSKRTYKFIFSLGKMIVRTQRDSFPNKDKRGVINSHLQGELTVDANNLTHFYNVNGSRGQDSHLRAADLLNAYVSHDYLAPNQSINKEEEQEKISKAEEHQSVNYQPDFFKNLLIEEHFTIKKDDAAPASTSTSTSTNESYSSASRP